MIWLFTLWAFTIAMLNIWAVCFCVKCIIYVFYFVDKVIEGFKESYHDRQ